MTRPSSRPDLMRDDPAHYEGRTLAELERRAPLSPSSPAPGNQNLNKL